MKASSGIQSVYGLKLNKLASNSETAKSWYDYILSRPEEEMVKDDILEIIKQRGPDFKIPSVIYNEMKSEKLSTDYTLPGYNYVGPGTRTTSNILKKIRAKNKLDEIGLHHDLDQYITRTDKDVKLSDDDAIKLSQYSASYTDYPLAKVALENLLGKGFGPKPDPKLEVFEYLNTLHEMDEEHMNDDIHQNHLPTTLALEYIQDQYNNTILGRQNYKPELDDLYKKELKKPEEPEFLSPPIPPDNLHNKGMENQELIINKMNSYGIPEEENIMYVIDEDDDDYMLDDHDYYADDLFEDKGVDVEELYINEDL